MTRSQKVELVQSLTEEFRAANGVVVADYKGMTVAELEALRNLAKNSEVKVRVLNNRLSMIALENAEKPGMDLTGTNIALWSEDLVAVAKVATQAAKESNGKLVVKAGHIEGEVVTVAQIDAYAKLPGKEELLGMLLSTWSAPARNMAYLLNAVPSNFVTVLENIRQKKESA